MYIKKDFKVTIIDNGLTITDYIKACDAKDAAYITLHKLSKYSEAAFPVKAWISDHIAINAFNVSVSVINRDNFLHVKVKNFYTDEESTGESEFVTLLLVELENA